MRISDLSSDVCSSDRMGLNGKDSIGFSAHGFRATASTILNEQGYRSDVIERQLAHAERDKVRASYNHAEYMDERKTMMQEWADYLDGLRKASQRSEEHTSELQSLMRTSYAVFCLKKKKQTTEHKNINVATSTPINTIK